ncbi:MAG: PAS domain-containing protein [Sandaracinaceae bacterium]|nr:PAS domain-containing protein [Sandaracinaceae bacterium]
MLSEGALERHEIPEEEIERLGLAVADRYRPVFAEPGDGFDVPLTTGSGLAGVLNVEYEPGLEGADLRPLADRAARGPARRLLRNARLLRESNYLRDNLARLLDHANAPIIVIGRDREMRVVNRAFLALTGAERERLLGRDFLSLLPETGAGPHPARVHPSAARRSDHELRGARPAEGRRARAAGDQHGLHPRARRRDRGRDRHRPRPDRAARARGAGHPGREARHPRAARGGRGARAEQPADEHLGVRRVPAAQG